MTHRIEITKDLRNTQKQSLEFILLKFKDRLNGNVILIKVLEDPNNIVCLIYTDIY